MSSQYRNPRKEFLKRPLLQDHGHPLLESLLTLPNKGSNGLFKELSVVDVEPPASLLASVLTGQTSFKSSTECEPRPAKVLRTLSSSSNDIEMFEQNSTASGMSTWTPNLDPIGYHGKRRPLCARCRNHGRRIILRGHKRHCEYKDCSCEDCRVTVDRQKAMAKQVAIRRHQDEDDRQRFELDINTPPPKPIQHSDRWANSNWDDQFERVTVIVSKVKPEVHRKELLVQAPVEQFNGQLASDCDKRRAFKPILTDITSNRPQEIYKQLLFDTFSEETFDLMLDTLLVHHVGDFDSLIKRMKIIQTIKLQQCTVARESSSVIVQ